MNRIKSLDGLRAISITMVLLSHASHTMPHYLTDNLFFKYISNGSLGVKVFFVISGYLITKLLLVEQQKTGTINIKHFYIRRVFRIFPVLYLYIFVVLLLKWTFIPDIFSDYYYVLFASFYLWNYMHLFHQSPYPEDKGYWFFGHFWSLTMEEQFYLLWPITFKKVNKKLLIKIVLVIITIMPLLRIITYFIMPGSRGQIGMMLQTGGDTILTGCLGALLEDKILSNKRIGILLRNNFFIAFICLFLFVISPLISDRFRGAYSSVFGITLGNIIILFLLIWSVYIPTLVSRVLNTKILIHIGILSYSLYVWQQLFLTTKIDFWANHFPQNLILALLVAVFSYYIVEKPILKLKDRFKDVDKIRNRPSKVDA